LTIINGSYIPWAEGINGQKKLFSLLKNMYMIVPEWVRVNRIIRDIPKPDIIGGNNNVSMRQDLDRDLKKSGMRPREIRTREVRSFDVDWTNIKLVHRQFMASNCIEYFISYEDITNDLLLGFIRLRLPNKKDSMKHYINGLKMSALIRELHVYGILSMVGNNDVYEDKVQHRGLGRKLLKEAETIAYNKGFAKIAIISGVGVREYYKKFGYELEDTYMVKNLKSNIEINDNIIYDIILIFVILIYIYIYISFM
jgi:elongator complex protein 3